MLHPIHIGLDVGGSKTEVQARAGSAALHRTGEGVNLQRDGMHRSTEVLAPLIAGILDAVEHDGTGSICLGIAGAGRQQDRESMVEHLRAHFGARLDSYQLVVEHDARIALEAAFEGESGAVVIAGTGSVVLARTEAGTLERAGGWGARIGDPGSGTAIGVAGLSAVADAFDGGPPTILTARLADRFSITSPEELIRAVYTDAWAVQSAAPFVVAAAEGGDWVCTRILKTQANALGQRAAWLAMRVDDMAPRIALMGGLAREAYYRDCLTEAIQRHLPDWRVMRPSRRPVHGALALAEQRSAEQAAQEMESGG